MIRSILVGTDGSETAATAVAEAIKLAAALDAELRIVSAYEPVPQAQLRQAAQSVPRDVAWMVNPRENVEATLQTAQAAAAAGGVSAHVFARQGDPADAILDVAEETGADLIVVGNKGMTGAKRFLLGSVPNKVSHHAPCSVMIIRTST